MNLEQLKAQLIERKNELSDLRSINQNLLFEEIAIEVKARSKAINILEEIISALGLGLTPEDVEFNKQKDSFDM